MTILVTGGTGFVGLALAEALKARQRDAVLFGRDPMPERFAPSFKEFPFVHGDVRVAEDVQGALDAAKPRIVVHLAAATPNRDAEMRDPASVVAANIVGTANLMRAVARLEQRPRVLIASSVAVYGETPPAGPTYREDRDAPTPASLYGITKLAAEQTALRLAQLYELDLTVVRLGPVYGPWEYGTGLRPLLSPHAQVVDLWRKGEDVVLPRSLEGDWIYSRDAGRGLAALAMAEGLGNRIYNLGGGSTSSLADWCRNLAAAPWARAWRIAAAGEPANVAFGLVRDRAPLDIGRIRTDVGFAPDFDVRTAAEDHLSWLNAAGRA